MAETFPLYITRTVGDEAIPEFTRKVRVPVMLDKHCAANSRYYLETMSLTIRPYPPGVWASWTEA